MESSDAAGGTIVDWSAATVIASPRAKVEPLRGQEALDLGFKAASLNYRVWIHYRTGILPEHRIFWGSLEFDILSVQDWRNAHIWLEIMALQRLI